MIRITQRKMHIGFGQFDQKICSDYAIIRITRCLIQYEIKDRQFIPSSLNKTCICTITPKLEMKIFYWKELWTLLRNDPLFTLVLSATPFMYSLLFPLYSILFSILSFSPLWVTISPRISSYSPYPLSYHLFSTVVPKQWREKVRTTCFHDRSSAFTEAWRVGSIFVKQRSRSGQKKPSTLVVGFFPHLPTTTVWQTLQPWEAPLFTYHTVTGAYAHVSLLAYHLHNNCLI